MTDLQQQRDELGADHSAQLDRISLPVRHEESQAQTNLQAVNQRLSTTAVSANDANARAEAAWQANHQLEGQHEQLPPRTPALRSEKGKLDHHSSGQEL